MLRDRNLIPLSHQHQHALALCVRIGKAFEREGETADVRPWETEIVRLFDEEMAFHFKAEEQFLFKAAEKFEQLWQLLDELRIEHTLLRRAVENARGRGFRVTDLQVFTASLTEHVRKEERELFESLQRLMSASELEELGRVMEDYFQSSGMPGASCALRPEQREK